MVARRIALATPFILALGLPAVAEELRPLAAPSAAKVDDIDESQCGLAAPAHSVKARLVVRNTLRRVGPYLIRLPGYATAADDTPALDPYAPFQIDAKPGDTLRIDLVDELTDAETIPANNFEDNNNADSNDKQINLHTHGLIVKPRPYGPCGGIGDYIFDTVDWRNRAHYRIDIPQRVAGGYLNAPKNDPDHDGDKGPFPAGPYWIHSHVHGLAKGAVLAGQSAFLSVDCPTGASPAACPNGPAALGVKPADVKVLALRDLQAIVDPDHTPDKFTTPDPDPTKQTGYFPTADNYDTTACLQSPDPNALPNFVSGPGYCGAKARNYATLGDLGVKDAGGNPSPAVANAAWLFTINGQIYPNLTLDAASPKHLWRIANMSAVVTYRLRLVDAGGAVQDAMKLVSADGVIAGEAADGAPGDFKLGVKAKEILLMPGSRAEVTVNWTKPAADQVWTLETAGFCTGQPAADGTCGADPYPKIALASVTMKGAPAVAELTARMETSATFSRNRVAVTPPPPPPPANCLKLPSVGYRTIRFAQDGANFFIGPLDTDKSGIAQLENVHSFRHETPGMGAHVCVAKGNVEMWVLENNTDELHNFHIHQSKFRLADQDELDRAHIEHGALFDPSKLLISQSPDIYAGLVAESKPGNSGAIWHDSIPVPPRNGDAPGHAVIVIPFTDDNQVGTFVYHCHILEHEDGGMMGVVEVYDPKRPRMGALEGRGRNVGFCGQPPAGYTPIPARAEGGWRERLAGVLGL